MIDVANTPTSFFALSHLPWRACPKPVSGTCPELPSGVALMAHTANEGSETRQQI